MSAEPADLYLRKNLVQALRKRRYGKLCREEPSDFSYGASLLSQGITWSMLASIPLWLMANIGLDLWQAVGLTGAFLLALAGFSAVTRRFGVAALMIMLAWVLTAVIAFRERGLGNAAITHLLPFVLALLGRWMYRALALAASIPFLLPIALVVVFLPLLTQDLWVVANDLRWQLIALAVVALGPLLVILSVRLWRSDIRALFSDASTRFANPGEWESRVVEAIKAAPREDAGEPPSDEWFWEQLRPIFLDPSAGSLAVGIGDELARTFRRQSTLRLFRFAIGIGAFFAIFVYALAWAAIPISTSSEWIAGPVSTREVSFAWLHVAVPTFPYISVAFLLSIVAAAAFIAFALTEDRYSTALNEVLLSRPAEECLELALPFRMLYDDRQEDHNQA